LPPDVGKERRRREALLDADKKQHESHPLQVDGWEDLQDQDAKANRLRKECNEENRKSSKILIKLTYLELSTDKDKRVIVREEFNLLLLL
jgi:DNA polymerase/3'-5' exonuclease PolX